MHVQTQKSLLDQVVPLYNSLYKNNQRRFWQILDQYPHTPTRLVAWSQPDLESLLADLQGETEV